MDWFNQTLSSFLDAVDSESPTPGSGVMVALTGCLGVALGRLIGHLTISRKSFLDQDESIQRMFRNNWMLLKKIRLSLMECVTKDDQAFRDLLAAFKLPKETAEEQEKREEVIRQAAEKAIQIPFHVATLCLKALRLIQEMVPYSHRHALGDVGISTHLLIAAIESSWINVKVNLSNLLDEEKKATYHDKLSKLQEEAMMLREAILQQLNDFLT